MNKIIVVTGQTATGKTSYAIKLAQEMSGEIINCDSRQLYKHLDIITGKDTKKDSIFNYQFSINSFDVGFYMLQGIKFWLYDVVDPKIPFSSFDYKELALQVIADIISRGKIPIIVGGSYLYIKHLLYGFSENVAPDWKLRNTLEDLSVVDLRGKLQILNNDRLQKMNNSDRNNPRRLIRQIEIATIQSIPTSNLTPEVKFEIERYVGLRFKDVNKLVLNIKERVQKRLEQGAIEEIESLLKMGYAKHDPGLNTIGYKEIIVYLEGKMSKQETIDRWVLSEIQYAKRQYTFMKKDTNIKWKDV